MITSKDKTVKLKLLYINNFEAPYRVPFFNMLAEHFDMTLALSQNDTDRKERNPKWFASHERKYRIVYLKKNCFKLPICFEIRKYIKEYDLVFMDMYGNPTNSFAVAYLKLKKIPFVMSVDGLFLRSEESHLKYLIKKFFLTAPSLILSPSEYTDKSLIHYGVAKENIRSYHFTSLLSHDIKTSGIASDEKRRNLREKLGMAEDHILISVGRFSYQNGYGKGYDTLMKIAESIDSTIGIYIIGDEPTDEFVEWKKNKKLDHVHFVGFKSKEELKDYYAAADLFVLLTRSDVWGLVINEAMSFGLPIITTDMCIGGLEMVKSGLNGYIVPVDAVDETANHISELMHDDDKRKDFSVESFKIIQDYSIEQMAADHFRCFDEFLK